MNAYVKLTWMQLKLFGREPVALFFTLAFPLMVLLLFGLIFGNAPDPQYGPQSGPQYGGGYGYIDALVPGLGAIVIGTVALMSIPVATANAREQKILRRYKAIPMPPLVYLAADITTNVFVDLIGLVILLIVAPLVFDLRFGGNWVYMFGGFLLSAFAFAAVGYIVAALSPTARIAAVVGEASDGIEAICLNQTLHISTATVKTHLIHIYGKLGVSDRTAAVTTALEKGILRLNSS